MAKKYSKTYAIIINGEEKEFRLSAGTLLKLKKAGIDISSKDQMGDIDNALQFIYFGLVNQDEYKDFEEMAEDIELGELNDILKKVGEIAGGVGGKN